MTVCGATGGHHVCELPAGHPPEQWHRQAISGTCSTSWAFDERPRRRPVEPEQLSLMPDQSSAGGGS